MHMTSKNFDFTFVPAETFSVYIFWPSVLRLNNLKLHKKIRYLAFIVDFKSWASVNRLSA